MITIAENTGIIPLELKLKSRRKSNAQGLAKLVLTSVFALKWSWWHIKSYGPIVAVLVLALGSLLVLQVHWLYRRLVHLSRAEGREKEVLKDAN